MKFDAVIGNPPYQPAEGSGRKDKAANLWTKFWVTAIYLTKKDGYVSLITPTGWINPSADLRGDNKFDGKSRLWDVFNSFTAVADIDTIAAHFPGINSTFGLVSVDKSGHAGLSFTGGYTTAMGFLPKDLAAINLVARSINGPMTLGSKFRMDQKGSLSDFRVSVPTTRNLSEKTVEILQGNQVATMGAVHTGLYFYIYVSSMAEAKKVKTTLIDNAYVLNKACRWSGFLNQKIFQAINYVG